MILLPSLANWKIPGIPFSRADEHLRGKPPVSIIPQKWDTFHRFIKCTFKMDSQGRVFCGRFIFYFVG
jgi:hypothetical protein